MNEIFQCGANSLEIAVLTKYFLQLNFKQLISCLQ